MTMNKQQKILFLHGLESKPGGTKPRFLTKKGYQVLNPKLPKSSFEESIAIAQNLIDTEEPDVVIGSSRGGAVAMCLNTAGASMVLIAPAWSRFRQTASKKVDSTTVVLHSKHDDIVEFKDSEHLAKVCGATLISVGDNHRMNDPDALEAMLDAVKWVSDENR